MRSDFTPAGGRVKLALSGPDAFHDGAVIEVEDTGRGLSDQEIGRIFEPLQRGSAAPGVSGIGLGLSVARQIVTRHRGELRAERLPKGARFVIELPRQPLAERPAARRAILVLEQGAVVRELVDSFFGSGDYEVVRRCIEKISLDSGPKRYQATNARTARIITAGTK